MSDTGRASHRAPSSLTAAHTQDLITST